MGTIEKRGKHSYRIGIQVKTPTGWRWIRKTIATDSTLSDKKQYQQAQRALFQLEEEVTAGHPQGDPAPHTLSQLAALWMEQHVAANCTPVTYGNYRYLLDSRILPMLGDLHVAELTPIRLTQWLNDLRNEPRRTSRLPEDMLSRARSPSWAAKLRKPGQNPGPLSESTILHYYTALSRLLEYAFQMELIPRNPMQKVPRPRPKKPKHHFLTEERALQLLRCLADEQNMGYRAAVLLGLLCGLRLGEACGLKLSDVDWDAGTIDVSRAAKYTPQAGSYISTPKSDAGQRLISLPIGMMAILEETRRYHQHWTSIAPNIWVDEGWIVHGWNGARLHKDTPSKWFRKFADTHGFPDIRFHDLRHSHATILLANGIDVVAVASRLGHSSADITLRTYAHALRRRDAESARVFDQLMATLPDSSSTPKK